MGEEKIHRYVIAGVITLLLFLLGFSLAIILDLSRSKWAESKISEQEVEYKSIQMQYQLISEIMNSNKNSNESCGAMKVALTSAVIDLNKALDKFLKYEKESRIDIKAETTKREYFLANIRYWMLADKYIERCKPEDLVIILYFYDPICVDCPRQGTLLTYYKNIFGNRLLVFPLDMSLESYEPVANMMKELYNVTYYPTIVINNTKYEGVIEKEELKRLICQNFLGLQPECKDVI